MNEIISLTTGTTRGLGRALFNVLNSLGSAYWINRTCPDHLRGSGGWICDLSDSKALRETCDAISQSKIPFNLVVLNAAHRVFASFEQLSQADFARSLQVNTVANFALLRSLAAQLVATKGLVIVCGSQAATHPFETGSAYCASKAALHQLAQVFMYEYRHKGVKTCILEMGAIRNRPKPNDDWKIAPEDVAKIVAMITSADDSDTMISRIEIVPSRIPLGDEAGPERLHRL